MPLLVSPKNTSKNDSKHNKFRPYGNDSSSIARWSEYNVSLLQVFIRMLSHKYVNTKPNGKRKSKSGLQLLGSEPFFIAFPDGIEWNQHINGASLTRSLHCNPHLNLASQQPSCLLLAGIWGCGVADSTQRARAYQIYGVRDVRKFQRSHSSALFYRLLPFN